jgi:hypothetical protein
MDCGGQAMMAENKFEEMQVFMNPVSGDDGANRD